MFTLKLPWISLPAKDRLAYTRLMSTYMRDLDFTYYYNMFDAPLSAGLPRFRSYGS